MFATKSLRGAVMFPKNRLMRMKDLQKRYTANRYFKTLTQEQPVTTLLKRQYSIPKSKQALNVCSWCKHNHGQFIPQMLRNTRNHLLLTSSIKDNALSKNSLNRLYRSMQMMGYHARGYATQADITTKVSVSKPIPSRRVARKKQTVDDGFHHMNVMCYAVGDELNLTALRNEIISGGVYDIVHLPRDIIEGIMITAKYQVNGQPREAFFFRDGGVALWHMSESERHDLWKMARSLSINPYDHHSIVDESDSLPVVYESVTKLKGNTLQLKKPAENEDLDEELALHKYTISNALSQSVNLSMNESKLEKFITQLEPETQTSASLQKLNNDILNLPTKYDKLSNQGRDEEQHVRNTRKLRRGNKSTWKKKDINMRLGELFTLRHEINLESGYLDHPDIYWEREELEGLYRDTISYFSIPKRIKVLNERLNYCSEILQLLGQQLNDQHHIRLEWIIIILILIEVIFECIHYAEKYGYIEIGNQYVNTSEQQNAIDYQQRVAASTPQEKVK